MKVVKGTVLKVKGLPRHHYAEKYMEYQPNTGYWEIIDMNFYYDKKCEDIVNSDPLLKERKELHIRLLNNCRSTIPEEDKQNFFKDMRINLRDEQKRGIQLIYERLKEFKVCLVCDGMRLGKTRISGFLAKRLLKQRPDDYIVAVCNAANVTGWKKEFIEECRIPEKDVQIIFSSDSQIDENAKIVIFSYHMMISNIDKITKTVHYEKNNILRFLSDKKVSIAFFDEAHKLKNKKSKTSQVVKKFFMRNSVRNQNQNQGGQADYTIGLTGTASPNGEPIELYNIVNSLGGKQVLKAVLGSSYKEIEFHRNYCMSMHKIHTSSKYGFTGKINKHIKYLNADKEKKLSKRLDSTIRITRKKEEIHDDLPKLIDICYLPKSKNREVIESRLEDLLIDTFKDEFVLTNPEFLASNHYKINKSGGEISTLRKEQSFDKVNSCYKLIEKELEKHDKVVVMCYYKDTMTKLKSIFNKYNPVSISGETLSKDTQKIVDKFNNDPETRVFIGQIESCKEGLNLSSCNRMLFVDITWSPSGFAQASERCSRIGKKEQVHVTIYVDKDSLDAMVLPTNIAKAKSISNLDHRIDNINN